MSSTGPDIAIAVDPSAQPRPLTARSVVLSTLLGYHPPELPVRTLVRVGTLFGIAESTVRVALVRMVTDGDVTTDAGVYRLAGQLLDRQRRQAESCSPRTRGARGAWMMAVVIAAARPLAVRTALRQAMDAGRLAELREGVWLRPANLATVLPDTAAAQCLTFTTRPADPVALANRLWNLPGWAGRAAELLDNLDRPHGLRDGFLLSARVLHHLQVDPVLPPELLPTDWPGDELRRRYAAYEADFADRLRSFGDR